MRALVDQFYVRLPKDHIQLGQQVNGIYWMPGDGHSEQRQGKGISGEIDDAQRAQVASQARDQYVAIRCFKKIA